MKIYCNSNCREGFQSDMKQGLIYGSLNVEGKVYDWKEGCIKLGRCPYCNSSINAPDIDLICITLEGNVKFATVKNTSNVKALINSAIVKHFPGLTGKWRKDTTIYGWNVLLEDLSVIELH